jgi:phage FluMu protein Com
MDGEWRCVRCQKLLGIVEATRLHIRFSRGHEYLVGFPVTSVCRACQTLNEIAVPQREAQPNHLVGDEATR